MLFEPFQRLDLAVQVAQPALLRAKMDRAPEDRLDMVRDYIDAAQDLIDKAAAEVAAASAPVAPPVGGGVAAALPPPGPAPATPVSEATAA